MAEYLMVLLLPLVEKLFKFIHFCIFSKLFTTVEHHIREWISANLD